MKPYILKNITDIEKMKDAETMKDVYYVIGAGGYYNSLTYKPWDESDETPSKLVVDCDFHEFLSSIFHSLIFKDSGTSNLCDFDEEDFLKDIEPETKKEVIIINSYILSDFTRFYKVLQEK